MEVGVCNLFPTIALFAGSLKTTPRRFEITIDEATRSGFFSVSRRGCTTWVFSFDDDGKWQQRRFNKAGRSQVSSDICNSGVQASRRGWLVPRLS
ncbi:hypothetical protein ACJRO7_020235 [Eucalyptus globulus]|uniref:Uncharacterized protein n=1 Tax=Eucalyptus globulus TaxID=34317 RepID=A0ABD3KFW7_EUCGL